jgi:hypothetical protein
MTTVQNNFADGAGGTGTITTGNSSGVSGDAFANITGPFVFSATGARSGLGGRGQIAPPPLGVPTTHGPRLAPMPGSKGWGSGVKCWGVSGVA